jgi:hypothetical protein
LLRSWFLKDTVQRALASAGPQRAGPMNHIIQILKVFDEPGLL